ncbi:hypothetical protein [Nannocystis pusilla]|uniref:Uncharacterized protein n=1 Tax=Nannocystis pusilla TaxID=889268 RepID=A0ABS7TQS4_9BACT|nr:hypothetical protein [Nannocystis pusilla]MBZ5710572.1 hypothetical protein [Nannocystis pusilla]
MVACDRCCSSSWSWIHEPDEPRPAQGEPEVRVVPEAPPIEDAPPARRRPSR